MMKPLPVARAQRVARALSVAAIFLVLTACGSDASSRRHQGGGATDIGGHNGDAVDPFADVVASDSRDDDATSDASDGDDAPLSDGGSGDVTDGGDVGETPDTSEDATLADALDAESVPCVEDGDCLGGQTCEDGLCVEIGPSCVPGATRCADAGTIARCNRAGTEEALETCETGGVCVGESPDARCEQRICEPEERGCLSDEQAFACDETGTARVVVPCDEATCVDGFCQPWTCQPGFAGCEDGDAVMCSVDGLERSTEACIDGEEVCLVGSDGPSCEAIVCAEGAALCSSDRRERVICDAAGTEWRREACPIETACDAGECRSLRCTPGSARCEGSVLRSCDEHGLSESATDCGDAESWCDSDDGRCRPWICEPGTERCAADGRSVLQCDDEGASETHVECLDDEGCVTTDDGAGCAPFVCDTGEQRCEDDAVYVCAPDRSGYVLDEDCGSRGCEDGACRRLALTSTCDDDRECHSENCARGVCSPAGMTFVRNGTFEMGNPDGEEFADGDRELPVHDVRISHNLFVGRFEVTQGEWVEVMGVNPSHFSACGDDCPVESVSWYDVVRYLNERSTREGMSPCYELVGCSGDPSSGCPTGDGSGTCGPDFTCTSVEFRGFECDGYRLPTEAEWEYFATEGGTHRDFVTGSIGATGCAPDENLEDAGWYCGNAATTHPFCPDFSARGGVSCGGTQPVGDKEPSGWGLYDLSGNVYEWVWDWYGEYPEPDDGGIWGEPDPLDDPLGPDTGSMKVRRGGSFFETADRSRLTFRSRIPRNRAFGTGFRVVRRAFVSLCYNGERNGLETDIDCGGGGCPLCDTGERCLTRRDCLDGECVDRRCR